MHVHLKIRPESIKGSYFLHDEFDHVAMLVIVASYIPSSLNLLPKIVSW